MPQPQKIPLFPLRTVLFPGMVLPLHIFEERYRHMVYRCVTENMLFGVVLIRSGSEVGTGATVFDIGTTAKIVRIDPLEDGRMHIKALGINRCKIRELSSQEPYRVGVVEDFPLVDIDEQIIPHLVQQVETLLWRYVETIVTSEGEAVSRNKLPHDAASLAFLVAMTLQIPLVDKQDLLGVPSLVTLLEKERQILERELEFVRFFLDNTPHWVNDSLPYSPN